MIQKRDHLDIGQEDLRGDGELSRTKKYIKRLCKLNFPDQSKEWQFIQNIRCVRNCLIHDEGCPTNLDNPDDPLIKAIHSLDGVTLNGDHIMIEDKVLDDFITSIHSFIMQVIDDMSSS